MAKTPVLDDEELFVLQLIFHLSSVFHAMQDGMYVKPSGLRMDVRSFFSLPIPKTVWQKWKAMQDKDFVEFVEECREPK